MLDLEVAGAVRELTDADIAPPAAPPSVKKLRDSHHALARALAHGLSPLEASAQTGYAPSRISTLQNDPAFKELTAFYRQSRDEVARNVEAQFLAFGLDFLQELHERLQDEPESFNNATMLEVTTRLLDRAGFAPISRSINKNMNVNIGERLDAARRKKEAA